MKPPMKTAKKMNKGSLVKDYAKLGDKMTGGLLKKGINKVKKTKGGGSGW